MGGLLRSGRLIRRLDDISRWIFASLRSLAIVAVAVVMIGCSETEHPLVAGLPTPGETVPVYEPNPSKSVEASPGRILIAQYDVLSAIAEYELASASSSESAIPSFPGFAMKEFNPWSATEDTLWRTTSIVGVTFPARWTVSPDASFASYWSMPVPDLAGDALPLEGPDFELNVRSLESGAERIVATRSKVAGIGQLGTVWSDRSDEIWYAVPTDYDLDRGTFEEPLPITSVDLHRVSLSMDDGAIIGTDDSIASTIDLAVLGTPKVSLKGVTSNGSVAVFAAAWERDGDPEIVDSKLVIIDVETSGSVGAIDLFEAERPPFMAMSPVGRHVAALLYDTNSGKGRVRLADLESMTVTDIMPAEDEHPNPPMTWSHDGRWFAWTSVEPSGWRVVSADDPEADPLFVRTDYVSSVSHWSDLEEPSRLNDHTLAALAPDAPIILIHAGVTGRDDGMGGQARRYETIDASTGQMRVLDGLPLGGARFHAWIP